MTDSKGRYGEGSAPLYTLDLVSHPEEKVLSTEDVFRGINMKCGVCSHVQNAAILPARNTTGRFLFWCRGCRRRRIHTETQEGVTVYLNDQPSSEAHDKDDQPPACQEFLRARFGRDWRSTVPKDSTYYPVLSALGKLDGQEKDGGE